MGFFIMLAVTFLVFFLLRNVIGILGAVALSVVFLIGWCWFNIRAGMTGLAKANMRAYFNQRAKGASHEEALDWVIRFRYPFSPEKQAACKDFVDAVLQDSAGEEDDLKWLVYIIFCYEAGRPPDRIVHKVFRNIDNIYYSMSKRYSFLLMKKRGRESLWPDLK